MVDIYEDLDNFDFGEEVEKLRGENHALLDKISELEEENKVLTRKNTVIEKEVKELRTNISSLLKTSTAEIQRKDNTIAELRERENTGAIRQPKPFLKHNPINNKPTELQGRQPEKAHFGIFKPADFPPEKGSTNRTTCQPINEERKQPENRSRNLLNSQQESTSISFASELGKALPVKDTQIDLFGIGRRYDNSLSFHNYAKTVTFGANETSQNDSLQNSIKAELDQTSSQLFDKVLERRLRQTQMEFEKDYSEVENTLHSKPLENKTSHKSPTRKHPSPRNKRNDYKRSTSRHRSRSRSNERTKRNVIRSRSPLRRPDHKSFHQGRSNSRDRINNFHDNSIFQGRSGKHSRYNEKGRRETERHFSRNIDRLRLDRKEHYNDTARKLSEERRRESIASGDSNRSSKHGPESERKPSPARSSKYIKVIVDGRLEIKKEKYAKNEPNTHFIDDTHVHRKKIKLRNSPHHEVHKKNYSSSTDKQENLSQSANYDIEEGEIQEQQTFNDAKKTACIPVHNAAKNDIPNTKVRLREAKEMPDRTRSIKVVDSSFIHHGLRQTESNDEPTTYFNDETHIPRKKIKLGNNSPRHEVHKKSSTNKQENISQSTNRNIEGGGIQEQQSINDAKKTAGVPIHNTAKNDKLSIKGRSREAKEVPDRTHSVKVVDSSIMHHSLKPTKPDGDPKTYFNDEMHIPGNKIKLGNNSPRNEVHKKSDLNSTDKQENLSQSTNRNNEGGGIQEQQSINDVKKTACVPIHNTAKNGNPSTKGRSREVKEMPDKTHSVKVVDSSTMHHSLKPTKPDGDPNTYFIDETHIPRNKIKLGNNSPRNEVHKKSDMNSTDKQENLSQPINCNIEGGEIQEQQTVNDVKKTACVPIHNTAENDNLSIKGRPKEAKEVPDRIHSVKVVDSSTMHHSLKPTKPDGDPNTYFNDETHIPRNKIKLGNNSPRNEVHKKSDLNSTDKQENLSQSINCSIEGGEIQEQQTVNDVKKTACVPNDNLSIKGRSKEAKEVPDRIHSVKVVDSSIMHHSLKPSEPDGNPNTYFNDKTHIPIGNNSTRHEVHKKSDLSSTDKQKNLSQSTDCNVEGGEIQEQQTINDAKKTACLPVNDKAKNENPNIKLYSREAKEMSDSTHSVKVVDSSIMHHGLKPTEPDGDSKTPSVTLTDDWTDSNSYSVKITKRPRRNIKYYFTDDDSKETAKTNPQVKAPVLITKESSENIHATNKPSVSSRHDTKDIKKHLFQPEMIGDTSMPKIRLEQDGNKSKNSVSKHHHEKSDSISEAVPQINLEKTATKSETSSKSSPEKSDLKCQTSVPKNHLEKYSANPEKSELKCNTLITKNKLARSDLFGDCSESDLKCNLFENNPEKVEVVDTWVAKSNPAISDPTHDTCNQLKKSDLKCYTRKSKKPLENSFTSKHTQADNLESKCDTAKHHHEKSGEKTNESKSHIEILDTKYDTSKHKHEQSDTSKPKTHVEISDSKCDVDKSIHHVEKSDFSKPKIHEENFDLNSETSKNKSHVEKSDSSKSKTHLNNSKPDSSKTKIHLEKCNISETDIEKSDTDSPKIHLDNSNSKSDFSKSKILVEKCETSKHKSHLEKSDHSKTKTHIDNSESKLDSSKTKTHIDSSESKFDSSKTKIHTDSSEPKSDSSKTKTYLDNLNSKHDPIKTKTHLEKYDTGKATNNIDKSDTNKPKTHLEKSDSKCDNSKTKIILEKSDSRKPKIHLENSISESDSSKPKTHIDNSESKSDTSKHKNHPEKSNTSKPKTHQDNSEAKCDSIKSIKQLEKTNSKCKSKTHIEKYDLFGETSENAINSQKTDLFGEISNSKTKTDSKSITSVSKNSEGKTASKCEFSKVKSNTDKSDTTLPKSVLKSDTCKTTTDLHKPGTTVPKLVSKSDTSNTPIDLHKSDTTGPKSVPKRGTSNTTIDLDKIDTTMSKLVPKGDTSNATIDLDKSDTTMPKLVSKCDISKTATDLEKSNEKHNLSESKQIEEKPVVKCETNGPAYVRKTCVTPISENTLHVKIFRRNTIIKKLSN